MYKWTSKCSLIVPHMQSHSNWAQGMSIRYSSALDCVRRMLREEGGVAALYRGASISILKTIPGAAIQVCVYV